MVRENNRGYDRSGHITQASGGIIAGNDQLPYSETERRSPRWRFVVGKHEVDTETVWNGASLIWHPDR